MLVVCCRDSEPSGLWRKTGCPSAAAGNMEASVSPVSLLRSTTRQRTKEGPSQVAAWCVPAGPEAGGGALMTIRGAPFLGPFWKPQTWSAPPPRVSTPNSLICLRISRLHTHSLDFPPPASSPSHSPSTRRSQTLDRPDRLVQQKLRHTELGTENPYIRTGSRYR